MHTTGVIYKPSQVNEAQLQYGSALAGSRYMYRPGVMPAAAHAPSIPATPPYTGAACGPLNRSVNNEADAAIQLRRL